MREQGPLQRRRAFRLGAPLLALGLIGAACSSGGSAESGPGSTPTASGPVTSAKAAANPAPAATTTGAASSIDPAPTAEADSEADAADPSPTAGPTPTLAPGMARVARVANTDGQGANLRAEPSAASRRIKVVRDGTEVELIGSEREAESRTWRNVRDDTGADGWIPGEFLVDERVVGPRPTPTPTPPTILVTDLTSPADRGEPATLIITTRPGIRCEVRVLLYGPGVAPREGLEPKVANENGECSWTWTVPPDTVPGAWRYAVAVGSGSLRTTREITFGVR